MTHANSCLRKLSLCALIAVVAPKDAPADDRPSPDVQALLAAHNRERAREKLGPLTLSAKLCESSLVHARDMARHQKLDHAGTNGSTVADRVRGARYPYARVGENIANGQMTVDQVMSSWIKSAGHRANILADFTEMGAARVEDADGVNYWCVNFGIPMPRLEPDAAAAAVVKEINRQRSAAGKARLEPEPVLMRAAATLSSAMAAKNSLEGGGDPFKVIGEKALERRDVRLQMSANVPTAEKAAKELVGDDADKLDRYREVGIGYAVADDGTPYWCAIFGRPIGGKRAGHPGK